MNRPFRVSMRVAFQTVRRRFNFNEYCNNVRSGFSYLASLFYKAITLTGKVRADTEPYGPSILHDMQIICTMRPYLSVPMCLLYLCICVFVEPEEQARTKHETINSRKAFSERQYLDLVEKILNEGKSGGRVQTYIHVICHTYYICYMSISLYL